LFSSRTPSSNSSKRTLRTGVAVSGPALALMIAAGGLFGTWSPGRAGSAADPAARQAGATSVSLASGGTGRQVVLDAYAAPAGARPAISGKAPAGGAGKAKRKATAKQIAWRMLHRFRWSHRQFRYLNRLWSRESGWNIHASNPYSGAYGIPQAVPGSKMASAGPHWRSDARTQIRWGMRYIRGRYGSPERAWAHEAHVGWY
jgi:hypothetical protein